MQQSRMKNDKVYLTSYASASSLDVFIAERRKCESMVLSNSAPLKLNELPQAIRDLSPGQFTDVKLTFYFSTSSKLDTHWLELCSAIGETLTNLTALQLRKVNREHDQRLAKLLQHMPPSVSKLHFDWLNWNIFALTLEQIGKSFPQLEGLYIRDTHRWPFRLVVATAATAENLARTLNRLQLLRHIQIGSIGGSSKPVIDVIKRSTRLEEVGIEHSYWHDMERDDEVAIKLVLRLNKAKNLHLMGESVTCRDVVNALCDVSDSIDCLYRILSESDPGLYVKPAIEASRSCKRQRTE